MVPVGLWAKSQQTQHSSLWRVNCELIFLALSQQCLKASPCTVGIWRCFFTCSLSLQAASRGSAAPAVIQAVYTYLMFHDVTSWDLSELCDIFNFRLFAGKWDKDYSLILKCQSQHFASLGEIWNLKTLGCPKGYFHNYTPKNYLKVLLHLSYTRHYSLVAGSEILIQWMLEEMTMIQGSHAPLRNEETRTRMCQT